jgi:hypothetical protein
MLNAGWWPRLLLLAHVAVPAAAHAQDVDFQALGKTLATDFLQTKLPTALELYWLNTDNDEESLALRYDWNSNREWKATDFGNDAADGTVNFGGRRSNVFARGNYVHKDDVNPSELSEIGAEWQQRWFPVYVANPLTEAQGQSLQRCLQDGGFGVTVEDCRERLDFGPTGMSYWYVDIDANAKIEGDQQFDERNYVFGVHTNLSRKLGTQRFIVNPILTLGLEQVDPANDTERNALLMEDDRYERLYAKLGFTGHLGTIRNQVVKYSVSVRYFKEISPEDAIEAAGLDSYKYSAFAVQIPAAAIPGFDNTRNSFMLTYGSGELPFNRSSEKTVELGFRHDIDFSEFF